MRLLDIFRPAPPAPDSAAVHQLFLDEALGLYGPHDRHSGLAQAIGIWAVRKLGASGASTFADAIVKGVQLASRGVTK
jgi:hypothetical protein